MFKYLKTLYSDSHPATVDTFPASASTEATGEIAAGSIVTLTFGEISPYYDSASPMYLALNSKASDEAKDIKCVRLTSNMVFEATVSPDADTSTLFVGAMCDAGQDDTGKGAFITRDGQPRFEIVDISELDNGKVTVVAI